MNWIKQLKSNIKVARGTGYGPDGLNYDHREQTLPFYNPYGTKRKSQEQTRDNMNQWGDDSSGGPSQGIGLFRDLERWPDKDHPADPDLVMDNPTPGDSPDRDSKKTYDGTQSLGESGSEDGIPSSQTFSPLGMQESAMRAYEEPTLDKGINRLPNGSMSNPVKSLPRFNRKKDNPMQRVRHNQNV